MKAALNKLIDLQSPDGYWENLPQGGLEKDSLLRHRIVYTVQCARCLAMFGLENHKSIENLTFFLKNCTETGIPLYDWALKSIAFLELGKHKPGTTLACKVAELIDLNTGYVELGRIRQQAYFDPLFAIELLLTALAINIKDDLFVTPLKKAIKRLNKLTDRNGLLGPDLTHAVWRIALLERAGIHLPRSSVDRLFKYITSHLSVNIYPRSVPFPGFAKETPVVLDDNISISHLVINTSFLKGKMDTATWNVLHNKPLTRLAQEINTSTSIDPYKWAVMLRAIATTTSVDEDRVVEEMVLDGTFKKSEIKRIKNCNLANLLFKKSRRILMPRVFIVHGRDDKSRFELDSHIRREFDVEPLMLDQLSTTGAKTIIELIEEHANEADAAIILLTPDDIGGLKSSHPDNKLSERARQNVIFELGFFCGLLGREKVLILKKRSTDMEIPSDMGGVRYIEFNERISEIHLDLKKAFSYIGIA